MTDKVIVIGCDNGQDVSVVVSVPKPIHFLEFTKMVKGMREFKNIKIIEIVNGSDHHICKYCGSVASGSDEDMLCDDCAELFGHRFFCEL